MVGDPLEDFDDSDSEGDSEGLRMRAAAICKPLESLGFSVVRRGPERRRGGEDVVGEEVSVLDTGHKAERSLEPTVF